MFSWIKRIKLRAFLKQAEKCVPHESEYFETIAEYYKKHAKKVIAKKLGLKLIVISDTHGDLAFGNKFEEFFSRIDNYDLCIILGDIYGYELEKILKFIPSDSIIALRGNHDNFEVYDEYGIRNINGTTFIYKGIRFAGIEGSYKYKNAEFPSYTHYESLCLACDIPKTDVLITHDRMFTESQYNDVHAGLVGITYYVYEKGVQWHIHGHIHESYQKKYSNGTNEKSVYGCEYLEI